MSRWQIHTGDVLAVLKTLPDESLDACLTDAPYGLSDPPDMVEVLTKWLAGEPYVHKGGGFMDEDWDAFVPGPEVWREVLRVLKPGATLMCFAGSRTYDLMGLSIRLAGFELRDTIQWLYGSGFPKSHNISMAIDKHLGAEREVVGIREHAPKFTLAGNGGFNNTVGENGKPGTFEVTAAATEEAQQWAGHGTALKPGYEPVIVAMKPLAGTYAENALEWGVAGLNIDAGRIGDGSDYTPGGCSGVGPHFNGKPKPTYEPNGKNAVYGDGLGGGGTREHSPEGRWPANVILDEDAAKDLDAQAGLLTSRARQAGVRNGMGYNGAKEVGGGPALAANSGGASRFFYVAKASREERDAGLDAFEWQTGGELTHRKEGSAGLDNPRAGAGRKSGGRNHHPTVKPLDLSRYLASLLLPPRREDGPRRILVPYSGSGSEVIGALLAGWDQAVAIEGKASFVAIAEARLRYWVERKLTFPVAKGRQLSLFGTPEGAA